MADHKDNYKQELFDTNEFEEGQHTTEKICVPMK